VGFWCFNKNAVSLIAPVHPLDIVKRTIHVTVHIKFR
jgi:hypothetical protein